MELQPISDDRYRFLLEKLEELNVVPYREDDFARECWQQTPDSSLIHAKANCHPSTTVTGGSIVCNGACLGIKCHIDDRSVVLPQARVVGQSSVSHSRIMSNAVVRQQSVVQNSIVGEGCTVRRQSSILKSSVGCDSLISQTRLENSEIGIQATWENSSAKGSWIGDFSVVEVSQLYDVSSGEQFRADHCSIEHSVLGMAVLLDAVNLRGVHFLSPLYLTKSEHLGYLQAIISGALVAVDNRKGAATYLCTRQEYNGAYTFGEVTEESLEAAKARFIESDQVNWDVVRSFLRAIRKQPEGPTDGSRRRLLTHSSTNESVDDGSGQ